MNRLTIVDATDAPASVKTEEAAPDERRGLFDVAVIAACCGAVLALMVPVSVRDIAVGVSVISLYSCIKLRHLNRAESNQKGGE